MLQVVLVAPQIATNTGNIIRLCANVGARLHLVEPLGFSLDNTSLRRAGLDYHELTDTTVHDSLNAALSAAQGWRDDRGDQCDRDGGNPGGRDGVSTWALTGSAVRPFADVEFGPDDVFVFGTERNGLAPDDLARFDDRHRLRIPMRPHNRSLNLANAVAVVTYEAWRQHHYAGAAHPADPTVPSGTVEESISPT